MKFHIKNSRFSVKSRSKEWKGADGGHSLNRDFTVFWSNLNDNHQKQKWCYISQVTDLDSNGIIGFDCMFGYKTSLTNIGYFSTNVQFSGNWFFVPFFFLSKEWIIQIIEGKLKSWLLSASVECHHAKLSLSYLGFDCLVYINYEEKIHSKWSVIIEYSNGGEISYHIIYPCTVKSRFNEWPPSAPFHSLNRDFTLNRDFLMWNFILVTRFHSLNRDFSLNRDSINRDFTVFRVYGLSNPWYNRGPFKQEHCIV